MSTQTSQFSARRWAKIKEWKVSTQTSQFSVHRWVPDRKFLMKRVRPHSAPETRACHQESGRAGRDAKAASCIVLFTKASRSKAIRMIQMGLADKLHFEQRFSRFLIYYFVLLVLHLLVSNLFFCFAFHSALSWETPKTIHYHCCRTWFNYIYMVFFHVVFCFHPVLFCAIKAISYWNVSLGLPPFRKMMFQTIFLNKQCEIYPKKWMCQLLQVRPIISPT